MDAANSPVTLDSLIQQILTIKTHLSRIQNESLVSCTNALSSQEAAKLQVSLAYALASLYFVLLRASGKDPTTESDIPVEIDRIKQYVIKLNGAKDGVAKRRMDSELQR